MQGLRSWSSQQIRAKLATKTGMLYFPKTGMLYVPKTGILYFPKAGMLYFPKAYCTTRPVQTFISIAYTIYIYPCPGLLCASSSNCWSWLVVLHYAMGQTWENLRHKFKSKALFRLISQPFFSAGRLAFFFKPHDGQYIPFKFNK